MGFGASVPGGVPEGRVCPTRAPRLATQGPKPGRAPARRTVCCIPWVSRRRREVSVGATVGPVLQDEGLHGVVVTQEAVGAGETQDDGPIGHVGVTSASGPPVGALGHPVVASVGRHPGRRPSGDSGTRTSRVAPRGVGLVEGVWGGPRRPRIRVDGAGGGRKRVRCGSWGGARDLSLLPGVGEPEDGTTPSRWGWGPLTTTLRSLPCGRSSSYGRPGKRPQDPGKRSTLTLLGG